MTTDPVERAYRLAKHRCGLSIAISHLRAVAEVIPDSNGKQDLIVELKLAVADHTTWLIALEEQYAEEDALARKTEFDRTHTWLQACQADRTCTASSPKELAVERIRVCIKAAYIMDCSWSSQANPEGISSEVLSEDCARKHSLMMASLSALSDDDISLAIQQSRVLELDGSAYAATSIAEVRRWYATYGAFTIAQCDALDRAGRSYPVRGSAEALMAA